MATKNEQFIADLLVNLNKSSASRATKAIADALSESAKKGGDKFAKDFAAALAANSKAAAAFAKVQIAVVEKAMNETLARAKVASAKAEQTAASAKLINATSLSQTRPARIEATKERTQVLKDANDVQLVKVDARGVAQTRAFAQENERIRQKSANKIAEFVSSANEKTRLDNERTANREIADLTRTEQLKIRATDKAEAQVTATEGKQAAQRLTLNHEHNNLLTRARKRLNDGLQLIDAKFFSDEKRIAQKAAADASNINLRGDRADQQRKIGQETVKIASDNAKDLVRLKRKEVLDVQHENRIDEINQRAHNNKIQSLFDGFKSSFLISFQNFLNRRRDKLQSSLRQEEESQKASFRRQQAEQDAQNRVSTGGLGLLTGRGAGPGLAGIAAAAGGGFGIASLVSDQQAFVTTNAVLQAQLKLTDAQMVKVKQTAIDLGKDFSLPGVAASDATEAIAKFVNSGIDLQAVLDGGARSALLLARTTDTSVPDAVDAIAKSMNVFGVAAKDTTNAAETIFNDIKRAGDITVPSFVEALGAGGGVLSSFTRNTVDSLTGLRQFSDVAALLIKKGLDPSEAGTGLKRFIQILEKDITPGSGDAAKALADLNKNVKDGGTIILDATGKFRSLPDVLRNLKGSLAGLSAVEQEALLSDAFGAKGQQVADLLRDTSDAALSAIGSVQGYASIVDVAKVKNFNLAGAVEALTSVISSDFTVALDNQNKTLINGAFAVATFTGKLLEGKGIYETIRKGIAGIAIAAAGLVTLKVGIELLGLLKPAIAVLLTPMGLFAASVLAIGVALTVFSKQRKEFVDGFTGDFDKKLSSLGVAPGSGGSVFVRLGRSAHDAFSTIKTDLANIRPEVAGVVSEIGKIFQGDFSLTGFEASLGALVIKIGRSNIAGAITDAIGAGVKGAGNVVDLLFKNPVKKVAVPGALDGATVTTGGDFGMGGLAGRAAKEVLRIGKIVGGGVATFVSEAVGKIDFAAIFGKILSALQELSRRIANFITSTVLSEPFLKAVVGIAVIIGAAAVNIGIGLVRGVIEGIDKRKGDVATVIKDVLVLGFRTAVDLALSGPIAFLVASVAAVFVTGKIVGAIASFAGSATKGFKLVGIAAQTAFGQIDTKTAKERVQALEAPIDHARAGLDNLGKSGKLVGLAADFQGVAGKISGVVAKIGGVQGAVSLAAGALGAFLAGKQFSNGGLESKIASIGAVAATTAAAFAASGGNGIVAGLTAASGAAGLLFGWLNKSDGAAQQLKQHITDATKAFSTGTDPGQFLRSSLLDLLSTSDKLRDDLKKTGINIGDLVGNFLGDKPGESLNQLAIALARVKREGDAGLSVADSFEQALKELDPLTKEVYAVRDAIGITATTTALLGDNAKTSSADLSQLLSGLPTSGTVNNIDDVSSALDAAKQAAKDARDEILSLGNLKIDTEKFKAQFEIDLKSLNKQFFGDGASDKLFQPTIDGSKILTPEGKVAIINQFSGVFDDVQKLAEQGVDPAAAFAGFKQKFLDSLKIPDSEKAIISNQIDTLFANNVFTITVDPQLQAGWISHLLTPINNAIANLPDLSFVGAASGKRNAFGSVITKPTTIFAGEDGAEVVIPLTKPARARQLMAQSGLDTIAGGGKSVVYNNTFNIQSTDPHTSALEATRAQRAAQQRLGGW